MYDSDQNPEDSTTQEKKCIVCGAEFRGFSDYCSTQCFVDDKEARMRRSEEAWFAKSSNRFRLDTQEKKFYDRLTLEDRELLAAMKIIV